MKWDMTKVVEEIVTRWKENEEEFIFETIHPYCEDILQLKINKEELKQIILRGSRPNGKWIPVSERLPETRDEVLISLANGQITIASYNDHFLPFFNKPIGWGVDAKRFVFDFCSDDVIAWMPLPEPYKED